MFDESWFDAQIWTEEDGGCLPDEVRALKRFYHHNCTVSEAAIEITSEVDAAANPPSERHRVYGILIDALIEWPENDAKRIVGILDEIQTLSTAYQGHDVWRGHPGFDWIWADLFHADPPLWRAEYDKASHELTGQARHECHRSLRVKQTRIAKAECQLVQADVGNLPFDWGFDAVCDALENGDAVLEIEIPVALQWLDVSSLAESSDELQWGVSTSRTPLMERFLEYARTGYDSRALRCRDLWKEEPKMSMKRWKFWRERLDEVRGVLDSVVRALVEQTTVRMREAESVSVEGQPYGRDRC